MSSFLRNKWFIYTAGLAFFFVLFRYYGYYEDAGRYLLQVVHFLHPERFVNDVPFMFGNQDSFTIFSPLLVVFFKIFGVNHGGMVAVFLLEFLWGIGAITLFVRWTRLWGCPAWALPAFIACLIVLTNKTYGSGAYFPIIDHILVARFAAEIFILLGLAFFWSKNRYVSLMFFLLASVLHPLMGGWCIPLWMLYHYPKLHWPVCFFVVSVPITGFLHVGGLDFYSNDWCEGPLPYMPTGEDALFFACVLGFWWLVWKFSRNMTVSKFASVVFWLSLIGIFWQYAGILMRHQLLVQVQPYRVLWFGFVPMLPMGVLCIWDNRDCLSRLSLWMSSRGSLVSALFGMALAFFVVSAFLGNMIQLALEHGLGDMDVARSLMDLPMHFLLVHKVVLCALAIICLVERKFWFAISFGLSLFNGDLTILPMVVIVLYLFPTIQGLFKKFLVAVAVVVSFVEYLSGLQASPLLESGLFSSFFFVVLFCLIVWIICWNKSTRQKILWLPFLLMIVTFAIWNVAKWDVRSESRIIDELQMDAFFDETIFPQVQDRGKILFVESREFPLQSRFKFLTGTYADETINIGEVFYKGQFLEARKRKNALLLGDTVLGNWDDYTQRIAEVYANTDTLLARVENLCEMGEITHFATDYANLPLPKEDSLFLDVKQKYVWLYECPVDEKIARIEGIF